ncbi:sulfatase [Catenovulum maritimum]|uniref:Sulfatase N-terminal domain-containing protein n=1 Tax=Catenovulum maritimum TaxID=1513271 RepID=A0A0J8GWR6_9ALTE|nr:sulfatase [Catenovulum maritimum]KMT65123.1 hypothetical protein XM47_10310 [Catenovulum maritimum]
MQFSKSITASILSLFGLFFMSVSHSAESKLNVLMIAVDDLNTDITSWGGTAKTPNIDKLAQESVQFMNAYTVVPACNPSRVAVMTGLRPETTGQFSNPGNFRDLPGGKDRVTMGQYFKSQGYQSIAAGKIFHKPRGNGKNVLTGSDPISWDYQFKTATGTPGVDKFRDENGKAKWLKGDYQYQGKKLSDYMSRFGIWGAIEENIEQTGDWNTANYCHEFLQQKHSKPFFLACGIFRPHSPQLAPKAFFEMYPYAEVELPLDPKSDIKDLPKISKTNFSSTFAKRVLQDKTEWKKAMQGYLASVSFADATIGHILDGFNKSQYKDNTVLVLWSDHGWQIGQKYRWEKFSLWKQATHLPLIIQAPNIKPAKVTAAVSLLDIFPTLVNLTNLESQLPLEGNDLTPIMLKPNMNWPHPAIVTYEKGNHSVVYGDYNFIHYKDGSMELYNHKLDPLEQNNIAKQKSSAEIIKQYKSWLPQ